MGPIMTEQDDDLADQLRRLAAGDSEALAALFARYRPRLRKMVKLRLDHRLQGRIDASDVLQEAFLDIAKRAPEYVANPTMPFFLWLRFLTGQRLLLVHRQHLGTRMRDASQEVSLCRGPMPQASSVSLAARLLGRITSPSQAAMRAEMQRKLQDVLNSMDATDREVLVLRHFEELTNSETAALLGIKKAAASNRYIRALEKLRTVLTSMPGFFDP
jgi:RNA polymerase sigma-70 factor (ECF subfamily)